MVLRLSLQKFSCKPRTHSCIFVIVLLPQERGCMKKEYISEILVDKVVFQYPIWLLSITFGKLLLRLIVTLGGHCAQFPQLRATAWTRLQSTCEVVCTSREKKQSRQMKDKDHKSWVIWRCYDIYGEIVLFTLLALPCCDDRGKQPTKVSTNKHMSDKSPKLWNRRSLQFLTFYLSANLGNIPDLHFLNSGIIQDSLGEMMKLKIEM